MSVCYVNDNVPEFFYLDMTASNFGKIIDDAIWRKLEPQVLSLIHMLQPQLSYSLLYPYVCLTGYDGANPKLQSPQSKSNISSRRLGNLGKEINQDQQSSKQLISC